MTYLHNRNMDSPSGQFLAPLQRQSSLSSPVVIDDVNQQVVVVVNTYDLKHFTCPHGDRICNNKLVYISTYIYTECILVLSVLIYTLSVH